MDVTKVMLEATQAANAAGDEWMAKATPRYSVHSADLMGNRGPSLGTMLDLCGNAYIKFNDKRSSEFKAFKKFNLLNPSGSVRLDHKFRGRQEHGLHCACAEAAVEVLKKYSLNVSVRDYID